MPTYQDLQNLINSNSPLFPTQVLTNGGLNASAVQQALQPFSEQAIQNIMRQLAQHFHPTHYTANFHIGLGNPLSDILIVGHELAINAFASNPSQLKGTVPNYYERLYYNEVLLNMWLWQAKLNGVTIAPNNWIQDPSFPPSFCHLYNAEKKKVHTWGIIHDVVQQKFPNTQLNFRANTLHQSFFNHVFLTELNCRPSKQSKVLHSNQ